MTMQVFLGTIDWSMVGWVLVGAVVLIIVVAAVGRAIAAAFPPNPRHMSNFRRSATKRAAAARAAASASAPAKVGAGAAAPTVPAAVAGAGAIPPEILAVIAAAVSVVLRGKSFAIKDVSEAQPKPPDIEHLMSRWSLEGRRQVYSSHTIYHGAHGGGLPHSFSTTNPHKTLH